MYHQQMELGTADCCSARHFSSSLPRRSLSEGKRGDLQVYEDSDSKRAQVSKASGQNKSPGMMFCGAGCVEVQKHAKRDS
jgi:hypothetical protein